jgi:hypothetical protein
MIEMHGPLIGWTNARLNVSTRPHYVNRLKESRRKMSIQQQNLRDLAPACLGCPDLSGVWQSAGEHFEVMFYIFEPAGQFYIREKRSDAEEGGKWRTRSN